MYIDNRQHHLIHYLSCFYFKLPEGSLVSTPEANIIHQQRDARMWSTISLVISSIDVPTGTIALYSWNWSLHSMSDGAVLRGSTLARNHRYYQFLCKYNKVSQWLCWMGLRINTTDDIDAGPWWHKTSGGRSAVLRVVRYSNLRSTLICQICITFRTPSYKCRVMCFEEDKMHGENRRVIPKYHEGDVAICFVRKMYRARDLLLDLNYAINK
jgi:hypothetical protein